MLHETAKIISQRYGGRIPRDRDVLESLPGIGPATAGAILAFAYDTPTVFLETNIRRVFIHDFFFQKQNVSDKEIMKVAEMTLDRKNPRTWYYALMDYGSMLGRQKDNPNIRSAHYTKQKPFRGSRRETRGRVLASILADKKRTSQEIARIIEKPVTEVQSVLQDLQREGFFTNEKE
jgi:A/G-specific adenine glycosylase